jgi:sodium-dependent phosphate cotransporter
MVSILIPLVTTGIIDTSYYILPYILGANIGTVFDVMIAALATGNPAAIGVWLIHLTINVVGACIFLPLLKPFSASVQSVNNFLTFSKKRTIVFLGLSNGIPVIILVLGIFL